MGRLVVAVAASAAVCVIAAGGAAFAQSPRAAVEGELDPALRAAIVTAIGETERPVQNRFDARRRAREAAQDAIAVLRSEGYYAYQVDDDVGDTDPPTPIVRIETGPRFKLAPPVLQWVGEAPQPDTQQAAEAALDLSPGDPARAVEILAAEGRAVAKVQASGYADVVAAPREVIVDHADGSVHPTFRITAGPLVRLDGLNLETEGRTNPDWLRRLAPWREGEPYDPEDVAELERRLLDTGVYESVTVGLGPKESATPDGLRPVVVSLADRPRRTLELGANYSTTDGAGVEARWTRYNVMRRADTIQLLGRLSSIDNRLSAELSLPHWRRPQQTLRLGGALYQVRTDAYDETGAGIFADVTRRYGKTSYLTVGTTLDFSRTDEIRRGRLSALGRDLVTVTLLGALALDRSDDPLDPKRGWRVEARAEPTFITGESTLPYLKLQTQGTIYFPFDERGDTVAAGRLRVGSILGGDVFKVPASRRFYAGGGGSVRGYAYQAVGPRLPDNTPQGGVSLLEASIELRRKVRGNWGVALFVDGGAVGSDLLPSGKDFSAGAGVGVRYDLGFAPIRVDVAVPLDRRQSDASFQIYLSIGQSF